MLLQFAEAKGFDPLVAENWYSVQGNEFFSFKGMDSMLQYYYKGSVIAALMHLFPEVGLDITKFHSLPRNHWEDATNRKALLDSFARDQGFDPLIPDNWYKISSDDIKSYKGARSVLAHHNGSAIKALSDLYPDISLNPEKFSVIPRNYWNNIDNQRGFFTNFARENKFDPTDPNNWYSIAHSSVKAYKRASSVLAYYKKSLTIALLHLFPDIGLDASKFNRVKAQ